MKTDGNSASPSNEVNARANSPVIEKHVPFVMPAVLLAVARERIVAVRKPVTTERRLCR